MGKKKKAAPTKEVPSVLDGDGSDVDNAWRYLSHGDDLFASRVHFFLVVESVLFVSFAATMSLGVTYIDAAGHLRLVTAALGILCTVCWWYANFRLRTRTNWLREELRKADPVYRSYLDRAKYPPASGWVLTHLLPAATLGAWIAAWFACR